MCDCGGVKSRVQFTFDYTGGGPRVGAVYFPSCHINTFNATTWFSLMFRVCLML